MKKIVYLCQTGTYSSLVVANLHLGNISEDTTENELLNLPNFATYKKKTGVYLHTGNDKNRNPVYTLGVANESKIIKKSAMDLIRIFGKENLNLSFVDVSDILPNYFLWNNKIITDKVIARYLKGKISEMMYRIKEYNNVEIGTKS